MMLEDDLKMMDAAVMGLEMKYAIFSFNLIYNIELE